MDHKNILIIRQKIVMRETSDYVQGEKTVKDIFDLIETALNMTNISNEDKESEKNVNISIYLSFIAKLLSTRKMITDDESKKIIGDKLIEFGKILKGE